MNGRGIFFVASLVAVSLLVLACGKAEVPLKKIQESFVYENGGCAYECTWGEGECIWNWGGRVVDGQCGKYQVCCDIGNTPKPQCTGICRYEWEGCGEKPIASGSCSDIHKLCCDRDGYGDSDDHDDEDSDSDDHDDDDGDSDDRGGYYFVAHDWHGYGYTDVGDEPGATITPITQNFTAGVNQICVSGTLVKDNRSVGLLGMNVDQAEGSDVKNIWNGADEYSGVYVDITKNRRTDIRLNLIGGDGNGYCTEIRSGASSLPWNDFATKCWEDSGTHYHPSVGISSINLYAPGDIDREVSFDYCLNDLYPIHKDR